MWTCEAQDRALPLTAVYHTLFCCNWPCMGFDCFLFFFLLSSVHSLHFLFLIIFLIFRIFFHLHILVILCRAHSYSMTLSLSFINYPILLHPAFKQVGNQIQFLSFSLISSFFLSSVLWLYLSSFTHVPPSFAISFFSHYFASKSQPCVKRHLSPLCCFAYWIVMFFVQ